MSILEIRTNLNNLKKIAKRAQKVEYSSSYSGYTPRLGEVSWEELNSKYKGNRISVSWQWMGKFEKGNGLMDEYLWTVSGVKGGFFLFSETYFYHNNKCYSRNYNRNFIDKRKDKKIKEIASIVKEKYLAQKEKNIEGMVK